MKRVVILAANLSLIKTEEYEFSNYQRENILKMFVVSVSEQNNLMKKNKKMLTNCSVKQKPTKNIQGTINNKNKKYCF
jgi:hypothetical protein